MSDEIRLPVVVPSLASILGWVESLKGTALDADEVDMLAANAPCMILPLMLAEKLDEARTFSDVDPQSAWDQWLYLREQIRRQGVPVGDAFPDPRDQLEMDIDRLRIILDGAELHSPGVMAHQLALLSNYASNWLTEVEQRFRR